MEMVARRYVERLVGCVENVTNEKCQRPSGEEKANRRDDPQRQCKNLPEAGPAAIDHDENDAGSHQMGERIADHAGEPRHHQNQNQAYQNLRHPEGQTVNPERKAVPYVTTIHQRRHAGI